MAAADGGTLHGLWPSAASALTCLAQRLPRFAGYPDQARTIAAALAGLPGVRVVPDPPQVPMMHLLLEVPGDAFTEAVKLLARERGVRVSPSTMPTGDPRLRRLELSVGDATCEFEPAEVREIFAGLVAAGR